MKKLEKNNKGFSLVELIVVVLIMAIIAVSLAPQVMKWVDNSRYATDRQTADALVSAAQLALTDQAAYKEVSNLGATKIEITINKSGWTMTGAPATNAFRDAFCTSAGVATPSSYPATTLKLKSDKTVKITIDKNGLVESDAASKLAKDDLDS